MMPRNEKGPKETSSESAGASLRRGDDQTA